MGSPLHPGLQLLPAKGTHQQDAALDFITGLFRVGSDSSLAAPDPILDLDFGGTAKIDLNGAR